MQKSRLFPPDFPVFNFSTLPTITTNIYNGWKKKNAENFKNRHKSHNRMIGTIYINTKNTSFMGDEFYENHTRPQSL